jgi:Malectin domain/K319L-like, PKD domain/Protein of unknown function (DUF1565)
MVDRGAIVIANTADPRIFQTEHYCVASYSIPITNGTYQVNLYFAETYLGITGAGQRVFDVNVGGQSLSNLDVYGQAGGLNSALVKTFNNVFVTGNTLSITFTPRVQCPMINGIEITGSSGPLSNQPPRVNAGPDQTITLPASANLSGTVSDDGLPAGSTLTTAWSKLSGPGTVTFGNAGACSTTATFSVSGTYVLRLMASDTVLSSTYDVTITVNPASISGPVFYVSTGGSDSNSGSSSSPWRTIQKAANTVSGGTTVIVAPGKYDERVTVSNSGSSGKLIVFQAQSGGTRPVMRRLHD